MNQKSRPVFDIAAGQWTPAPISPQVNGSVAGGGVLSGSGVAGDTFTVKLADLAWPRNWRDDPPGQALTVVLTKTEGGSLPTTVALLQGDAMIKGEEFEPAGLKTLTLTKPDVEQITDYHALSVRVIAGRPAVGCCANIPALLTATFHTVVNCNVLEGVTVPLCWNGVDGAWKGSKIVCGMPLDLRLVCSGSGVTNFQIFGHWGSGGCTIPFGAFASLASQCAPLLLNFSLGGVSISGNCPCCPSVSAAFEIDVTI